MKKELKQSRHVLLAFMLLLTACQKPQESSDQTEMKAKEQQQTSDINLNTPSELEVQIQSYGTGILFPYYALGLFEGRVKEELDFSLDYDFYSFLNSWEVDPKTLTYLEKEWELALKNLSEEEKRKWKEKAILYLRISQVLSYELTETSGESFFETAYEIEPLHAIMAKYIDPKIGQGPSSLASGQMGELDIEFWNYLVELPRKERLEIIARLLHGCASSDE